jgi:PIN domain nuclease of toxin-antitoxin system
MLLLDTHVFLWWRTNDERLNATARDAIATAPIVFDFDDCGVIVVNPFA